jgi:hypothetical protein
MPGLVPDIHAVELMQWWRIEKLEVAAALANLSTAARRLRVDGRDKPGHDGGSGE